MMNIYNPTKTTNSSGSAGLAQVTTINLVNLTGGQHTPLAEISSFAQRSRHGFSTVRSITACPSGVELAKSQLYPVGVCTTNNGGFT